MNEERNMSSQRGLPAYELHGLTEEEIRIDEDESREKPSDKDRG
jgi:hypothetical protein